MTSKFDCFGPGFLKWVYQKKPTGFFLRTCPGVRTLPVLMGHLGGSNCTGLTDHLLYKCKKLLCGHLTASVGQLQLSGHSLISPFFMVNMVYDQVVAYRCGNELCASVSRVLWIIAGHNDGRTAGHW